MSMRLGASRRLPIALAAVVAGAHAAAYSPLRNATRGEWDVPMEMAVSGSRLLTITLDQ